jgi:hypothetical protein
MKIKIDSRPIRDQCTDHQYRILLDATAVWCRKGSICRRIISEVDGYWSICENRIPKEGSLFAVVYWDGRAVQGLIKRGWLVPILSSEEVKVQYALGLIYDIPFKIVPVLCQRVIKECKLDEY